MEFETEAASGPARALPAQPDGLIIPSIRPRARASVLNAVEFETEAASGPARALPAQPDGRIMPSIRPRARASVGPQGGQMQNPAAPTAPAATAKKGKCFSQCIIGHVPRQFLLPLPLQPAP